MCGIGRLWPTGTLDGVYRPTHAPRPTGEVFDADVIILDEVGDESLNEMVSRKNFDQSKVSCR